MIPIPFQYQTKVLQPSGQKYSDNVSGVDPLPVWTDDEQCVSCWRPSFKERLSILFFGRVWLGVLSGSTQYPVYVETRRIWLKEAGKPTGLRLVASKLNEFFDISKLREILSRG